jgi:predicted GNAT family acetyltransferase
MDPEITHDETACRFLCSVQGLDCELEYELDGTAIMDICHTYVHPSLRGGGIAAALMKAATEFAAQRKYSVRPSCSYAALFYQRFPRYVAMLPSVIGLDHGGACRLPKRGA